MIGWWAKRRAEVAEAKRKLAASQTHVQNEMFEQAESQPSGLPLPVNAPANAVPSPEDLSAPALTLDQPVLDKGIRRLFRKGASKADDVAVNLDGVEPGRHGGKSESKEEEFSVPTMVVIDFYQGLAKYSEAEQLARAFIEQHFSSPNASYYYLKRWRGGMAIEIQQGGGRAFLPEALERIDADPSIVVAVPASNRITQVMLNPETGVLETLLLPAQQGAPEGAHKALPGPAMKPFDRRGARLAVVGVAMATVTGCAALFSIGSLFLDKDSWAAPYLSQAPVDSLPVSAQAQRAIKDALASGDCVYKLEYSGSWKATPGWAAGGVCVGVKPPTAKPSEAPEPQASGGPAAMPDASPPPPALVPPPPGAMAPAAPSKEAM